MIRVEGMVGKEEPSGPLVAPAPPRYYKAVGGRREDRLNYVLRIIGEGENEADYFVCRRRRRNTGLVVEKR